MEPQELVQRYDWGERAFGGADLRWAEGSYPARRHEARLSRWRCQVAVDELGSAEIHTLIPISRISKTFDA